VAVLAIVIGALTVIYGFASCKIPHVLLVGVATAASWSSSFEWYVSCMSDSVASIDRSL
jgi:hypothetical protein